MTKTEEMNSTPAVVEGPAFRQSRLADEKPRKPEPALLQSSDCSPDCGADEKRPKLYGRQAEEKDLLAAYRRCVSSRHHSDLVLITGPSGTGKVGAAVCTLCLVVIQQSPQHYFFVLFIVLHDRAGSRNRFEIMWKREVDSLSRESLIRSSAPRLRTLLSGHLRISFSSSRNDRIKTNTSMCMQP